MKSNENQQLRHMDKTIVQKIKENHN